MSNIIGPEKSWRLVYDDSKSWHHYFESDGFTESISYLEEFSDYQSGLNRIFDLNLITDEDLNQGLEYVPEPIIPIIQSPPPENI